MTEHTLAKIKDVVLYVGLTASASDCYTATQLLKNAGITYKLLNYADQEEHHKATFGALSTWPLGLAGQKREFSEFPVLVWDECYSDFTVVRQAAQGLDEIKSSVVLEKPELTG